MNDRTGNISSTRAARMLDLIKAIAPLPRMANSPGLDQAFEMFKWQLPGAIIHEYPAGMEREDWIVPRSWRVTSGVMKDEKDCIVASVDESMLFVAPYSKEVEGWFTKPEIEPHLRTCADRADAFCLEHRNAYDYQLVDWGITMPYKRWRDLPQGRYFIKIEVEWGKSSMKLGEYFLPGRREEIICICAHIDELCQR